MFALPHTSTVKGKFNWYEWPACVYETDQEVAEAIQNNACFGKTLRRIKVIGDTRACTTNKLPFSETDSDVSYVKGVHANEPIVFEFEDGSTIEFLVQYDSMVRIGFNSIPNEVKDGLRSHNDNFDHFFKSHFNLFIGKQLQRIEIETIRNDNIIFKFDHEKHTKGNLGDPEIKLYRFIFTGGYTISLKNSEFGGYLIQIYIRNTSKLCREFSHPELIAFDDSFIEPKSSGWFYGGFDGDFVIYPDIGQPKNKVDSFLSSCFLITCDEHEANTVLKTFWEQHLPQGGRFELWECNLYDYNTMHTMINHIQSFVDRVENNVMNDEDKAILEKVAQITSQRKKSQSIARLSESKGEITSPMDCFMANRDFLLQFCDYVSAMMIRFPDCQHICIEGP